MYFLLLVFPALIAAGTVIQPNGDIIVNKHDGSSIVIKANGQTIMKPAPGNNNKNDASYSLGTDDVSWPFGQKNNPFARGGAEHSLLDDDFPFGSGTGDQEFRFGKQSPYFGGEKDPWIQHKGEKGKKVGDRIVYANGDQRLPDNTFKLADGTNLSWSEHTGKPFRRSLQPRIPGYGAQRRGMKPARR